jgi:hypothetical protein
LYHRWQGDPYEMLTTNRGPQGQVHEARNLSSLSGLPCRTQAFLNLQLASPIESHAI